MRGLKVKCFCRAVFFWWCGFAFVSALMALMIATSASAATNPDSSLFLQNHPASVSDSSLLQNNPASVSDSSLLQNNPASVSDSSLFLPNNPESVSPSASPHYLNNIQIAHKILKDSSGGTTTHTHRSPLCEASWAGFTGNANVYFSVSADRGPSGANVRINSNNAMITYSYLGGDTTINCFSGTAPPPSYNGSTCQFVSVRDGSGGFTTGLTDAVYVGNSGSGQITDCRQPTTTNCNAHPYYSAYEGGGTECTACTGSVQFRNPDNTACVAACPAGSVADSNKRCEYTQTSCRANGQGFQGGACQTCAADQIISSTGPCSTCLAGEVPNADKSQCIRTIASCNAIGDIYNSDMNICERCNAPKGFRDGNECVTACPTGGLMRVENTKGSCYYTQVSCNAQDLIFKDNRCESCSSSSMVYNVGNGGVGECVATCPADKEPNNGKCEVRPITAELSTHGILSFRTVASTASYTNLTYQWKQSDAANGTFTDIVGATDATYFLTQDFDIMKPFVRVEFNFTDGGNPEKVTSPNALSVFFVRASINGKALVAKIFGDPPAGTNDLGWTGSNNNTESEFTDISRNYIIPAEGLMTYTPPKNGYRYVRLYYVNTPPGGGVGTPYYGQPIRIAGLYEYVVNPPCGDAQEGNSNPACLGIRFFDSKRQGICRNCSGANTPTIYRVPPNITNDTDLAGTEIFVAANEVASSLTPDINNSKQRGFPFMIARFGNITTNLVRVYGIKDTSTVGITVDSGNALRYHADLVGARDVFDQQPNIGDLDYKWQRGRSTDANDSSWQDIPAETSSSYTLERDDLVVGGNVYTHIRLVANDNAPATTFDAVDGFESVGTVTSNIQAVDVPKIIITNILSDSGELSFGSESTTTDFTNLSYQWEQSDAVGGTYTDISGATDATYDIPDDYDYSKPFVRVKFSYTDAGNAFEVLSEGIGLLTVGTMANSDGLTITFSGRSTTGLTGVEYKWQHSTTENGSYTDIGSATSDTYNPTQSSGFVRVEYSYTSEDGVNRVLLSPAVNVATAFMFENVNSVDTACAEGGSPCLGIRFENSKREGICRNCGNSLNHAQIYRVPPNTANDIRTGLAEIFVAANSVAASYTPTIDNSEQRGFPFMIARYGDITTNMVRVYGIKDTSTVGIAVNGSNANQYDADLSGARDVFDQQPNTDDLDYKWQRGQSAALNHASWQDIPSETSSSYTLEGEDLVVGANTYTHIRMVATDNAPSTNFDAVDGFESVGVMTSNIRAVSIPPILVTSALSDSDLFSFSTGANMSDFTNITYQWEQSDSASGTYTDISGATDMTYNLPNDYDYSKPFVRLKFSYTYGGNALEAFSQEIGLLTVGVSAYSGGLTITFTGRSTTGLTGVEYKWQESTTENGSYTDIGGATNDTYNPTKSSGFVRVEYSYTTEDSVNRVLISPAVNLDTVFEFTNDDVSPACGDAQEGGVNPACLGIRFHSNKRQGICRNCNSISNLQYYRVPPSVANDVRSYTQIFDNANQIPGSTTTPTRNNSVQRGYPFMVARFDRGGGSTTLNFVRMYGIKDTSTVGIEVNSSNDKQYDADLSAVRDVFDQQPDTDDLDYKWQRGKDAAPNHADWEDIPSETGTSYTVDNSDFNGGFNHIRMVATDNTPATKFDALDGFESVGMMTSNVQVISTLEITAALSNAGELSFNTGTDTGSYTNLNYQWQQSDAANGTYTDISGATDDTYTAPINYDYSKSFVRLRFGYSDSSAQHQVFSRNEIQLFSVQMNANTVSGIFELGTLGKATTSFSNVQIVWQHSATRDGSYTTIAGESGTSYMPTQTNGFIRIQYTYTDSGSTRMVLSQPMDVGVLLVYKVDTTCTENSGNSPCLAREVTSDGDEQVVCRNCGAKKVNFYRVPASGFVNDIRMSNQIFTNANKLTQDATTHVLNSHPFDYPFIGAQINDTNGNGAVLNLVRVVGIQDNSSVFPKIERNGNANNFADSNRLRVDVSDYMNVFGEDATPDDFNITWQRANENSHTDSTWGPFTPSITTPTFTFGPEHHQSTDAGSFYHVYRFVVVDKAPASPIDDYEPKTLTSDLISFGGISLGLTGYSITLTDLDKVIPHGNPNNYNSFGWQFETSGSENGPYTMYADAASRQLILPANFDNKTHRYIRGRLQYIYNVLQSTPPSPHTSPGASRGIQLPVQIWSKPIDLQNLHVPPINTTCGTAEDGSGKPPCLGIIVDTSSGNNVRSGICRNCSQGGSGHKVYRVPPTAQPDTTNPSYSAIFTPANDVGGGFIPARNDTTQRGYPFMVMTFNRGGAITTNFRRVYGIKDTSTVGIEVNSSNDKQYDADLSGARDVFDLVPETADLTYQWQRGQDAAPNHASWQNIPSETSSSYTIDDADFAGGYTHLRLVATDSTPATPFDAYDNFDSVGSMTSNIEAVALPVVISRNGTNVEGVLGSAISAESNIRNVWEQSDASDGTYTAINGATDLTYAIPTDYDFSKPFVRLSVVYGAVGSEVTITSAALELVGLSGNVAINSAGKMAGDTQTADRSALRDFFSDTAAPAENAVSYQWQVGFGDSGDTNWSDIGSATNATYDLAETDFDVVVGSNRASHLRLIVNKGAYRITSSALQIEEPLAGDIKLTVVANPDGQENAPGIHFRLKDSSLASDNGLPANFEIKSNWKVFNSSDVVLTQSQSGASTEEEFASSQIGSFVVDGSLINGFLDYDANITDARAKYIISVTISAADGTNGENGMGYRPSETFEASYTLKEVGSGPSGGAVAVNGNSFVEGSKFTIEVSGGTSANGTLVVHHQWENDDNAPIANATTNVYTLPADWDKTKNYLLGAVTVVDIFSRTHEITNSILINRPASGLRINYLGGVVADKTLQADTDSIADDNGTSGSAAVVSYSWLNLNNTPTNAQDYILNAQDVADIKAGGVDAPKLQVVWTDEFGFANTMEVEVQDGVVANVSRSGTDVVGNLLNPISAPIIRNVWEQSNVASGPYTAINGATDLMYTIPNNYDFTKPFVRLSVVYGTTPNEVTITSAALELVGLSGNVAINSAGTEARDMQTANRSGLRDFFSAEPAADEVDYQWQVGIAGMNNSWSNISNATNATYNLLRSDFNVSVSNERVSHLRVLAHKGLYTIISSPLQVSSEPTGNLAVRVIPNSLGQENAPGVILSANADGISDANGLGDFRYNVTFQIYNAAGNEISIFAHASAGAGGTLYTLSADLFPTDEPVDSYTIVYVGRPLADGLGYEDKARFTVTHTLMREGVTGPSGGVAAVNGNAYISGSEFTATYSGVRSPNGVLVEGYQWQGVDSDGNAVAAAGTSTNEEYTLSDSWNANYPSLRVLVTVRDIFARQLVLTSPARAVDQPTSSNELFVEAVDNGGFEANTTVRANISNLTDSNGNGSVVSYSWQNVSNTPSNGQTYILSNSDVMAILAGGVNAPRLVVVYEDALGFRSTLNTRVQGAVRARLQGDTIIATVEDRNNQFQNQRTFWQRAASGGAYSNISGASGLRYTVPTNHPAAMPFVRVGLAYSLNGTRLTAYSAPIRVAGLASGAVGVSGSGYGAGAQYSASLSDLLDVLGRVPQSSAATYQWQSGTEASRGSAGWRNINNATNASYSLATNDFTEGRSWLRLVIADASGHTSSNVTLISEGINIKRAASGNVMVVGDTVLSVGNTYRVDTGNYSDENGALTYTYEWYRRLEGGGLRSLGTNANYVVALSDFATGRTEALVVTLKHTDVFGFAGTTSAELQLGVRNVQERPMIDIGDNRLTVGVMLAGTVPLSADSGTFAYQWGRLRSADNVSTSFEVISGATNSSYALPSSWNITYPYLALRVIYTDHFNVPSTLYSDALMLNRPTEGELLLRDSLGAEVQEVSTGLLVNVDSSGLVDDNNKVGEGRVTGYTWYLGTRQVGTGNNYRFSMSDVEAVRAGDIFGVSVVYRDGVGFLSTLELRFGGRFVLEEPEQLQEVDALLNVVNAQSALGALGGHLDNVNNAFVNGNIVGDNAGQYLEINGRRVQASHEVLGALSSGDVSGHVLGEGLAVNNVAAGVVADEWTAWVRSTWSDLSGTPLIGTNTVSYAGDATGVYAGYDELIGRHIRLGLSAGRSRVDIKAALGSDGLRDDDVRRDIDAVLPYLEFGGDSGKLRLMGGYGTGDLHIKENDRGRNKCSVDVDVDWQFASAGGEYAFRNFFHQNLALAMVGNVMHVRNDTEGGACGSSRHIPGSESSGGEWQFGTQLRYGSSGYSGRLGTDVREAVGDLKSDLAYDVSGGFSARTAFGLGFHIDGSMQINDTEHHRDSVSGRLDYQDNGLWSSSLQSSYDDGDLLHRWELGYKRDWQMHTTGFDMHIERRFADEVDTRVGGQFSIWF